MNIRPLPRDDRKSAESAPPAANFSWRLASQVATVGIFVILFWAVLDQARVILLPIVSAFVVGLMLGPLVGFAGQYKIPAWLSALVLVVLVIAFFNIAIMLLSAPVIEWVGRAPEIGQSLKEKFQFLDRPMAALRDIRTAIGDASAIKVDTGGPNFIAPALAVVTPAVGQLVIFFTTLFFVLWGRSELRRSLVSYFDDRAMRLRTLRVLNAIEHDLTSYLSVVAVIYLVVGLITGIAVVLIGYPNAVVWGVLAFVLNFIPYLGPLIMVIVLFGVGLISFDTLTHAAIAPVFYVAVTTIEGHFVTPSVIGRRLTLNPLIVFLALAFWTWLWGPVGAFLAVPILIAALAAMRHMKQQNGTLPG